MSARNHETLEYFCLPIGDTPDPANVPKRLKTIAHELQAIIGAWGSRIARIDWTNAEFRVHLRSEPTEQLVPTPTIPDAIATTVQELRANAARPDPQSHTAALTIPNQVSPLRAIARYSTNEDPPVTYHTDDAVYVIPRLTLDDFIEPPRNQQYHKHVAVLIIGVYVDLRSGVTAMKTKEGLHIHMDADLAKKINPETFGQTLAKTHYVGEITRSDNNEWTTVPGGQLYHQAQLAEFTSME